MKTTSEIFSITVDNLSEYEKRRRSSILQEIRHNLENVSDRARDDRNNVKVYSNDANGLNGVHGKFAVRRETSLAPDDDRKEKHSSRRVGRRRWVILFAGFIGTFLNTSFQFNMSVLYVEFLNEFGKSKAETALVQSVCSGTFLCAGFISGSLVTRFGSRKCGVIGGGLVGVGLMTSFFAMNIYFLVGSLGIVAGFGFSLSHVATTSAVSQHFHGRSKLLAISFVTFGSGIGSLSVPFFLELLLNYYNWRGALLIVSGVGFHLCVIGCLFVPPETRPSLTPCTGHVDTKRRRSSISIHQQGMDSEIPSNSVCDSLRVIFCHVPYIMYILSVATAMSLLNSTLVFFIDYYQAKGFDRSTAVWLYFATNLSGCVFRFIPGVILQSSRVPIMGIPCLALVVGTGTFVAYPFCTSLPHFIASACGFGIALGFLVAVYSITTMEIAGQRYFSTALGVLMTTAGIATTVAGPISGFLRDVTGSYDSCFFTGSVALFVAFVILSCVGWIGYRKDRKLDHFNKEIEIRRKSRRRSSILPWKREVEFPTT